jgi:hypothetical protein
MSQSSRMGPSPPASPATSSVTSPAGHLLFLPQPPPPCSSAGSGARACSCQIRIHGEHREEDGYEDGAMGRQAGAVQRRWHEVEKQLPRRGGVMVPAVRRDSSLLRRRAAWSRRAGAAPSSLSAGALLLLPLLLLLAPGAYWSQLSGRMPIRL